MEVYVEGSKQGVKDVEVRLPENDDFRTVRMRKITPDRRVLKKLGYTDDETARAIKEAELDGVTSD